MLLILGVVVSEIVTQGRALVNCIFWFWHVFGVCTGCVLITFKSPLSVPPYRIENKTSDVMIYFAQSSVAKDREKWNWLRPGPSGSSMAYAWDEPCQTHRLQVQVCSTPENVQTLNSKYTAMTWWLFQYSSIHNLSSWVLTPLHSKRLSLIQDAVSIVFSLWKIHANLR